VNRKHGARELSKKTILKDMSSILSCQDSFLAGHDKTGESLCR